VSKAMWSRDANGRAVIKMSICSRTVDRVQINHSTPVEGVEFRGIQGNAVRESNEPRQKRPVADEMRCEPYDTLNGEEVFLRHVTHVVNSVGLAGEKPTMIRGQGCSCSWISQKLCKL
jgi:hypothetical protein